MTKEQLREELSNKGVKTTSKMTKVDLINLYEAHADVEVKSPQTRYKGSPEK